MFTIIYCSLIVLAGSHINADKLQIESNDKEEWHYPQIAKIKITGGNVVMFQDRNKYVCPANANTNQEGKFTGIKKVLHEDIDGDGENEYILGFQGEGLHVARMENGKITDIDCQPHSAYGLVLICRKEDDKLNVKAIIELKGYYYEDVLVDDIDKDGIKDVVIISGAGPRQYGIKIISYKNGDYKHLYNNIDHKNLEQSYEINEKGLAQIKIAMRSFKEGKQRNALYKLLTWDGEKFGNPRFIIER